MNESKSEGNLEELLNALGTFQSPRETCFLCGRGLLKGDYTEEHVIPQWAQNRYELRNQELVLLNRTSIPYRQLTVPCCDECNRYRLKPIEDSVSQTVEAGRNAVLSLGHKVLFLWLGKIIYGILYKELLLLLERSDPASQTIITPAILERFQNHRFFLQQARETVELVDFRPGSIFVFSMQALPERKLEWDLTDNVDTMFIGCRVGRVALFATLADGGAQQAYKDAYQDIGPLELHPIQFRELCAHFSYRSTLATRTPKYITIQGSPHKVHQMALAGFSTKPLFDDWDMGTYARFLAYYTGEDVARLYVPPNKVMTWLHDENGNPRFMSFKDYPIP